MFKKSLSFTFAHCLIEPKNLQKWNHGGQQWGLNFSRITAIDAIDTVWIIN